MEIIYALVGLATGFFISFLIFRSKKSDVNNDNIDEFNELEKEFIKVGAEKEQLLSLLNENKISYEKLNQENKVLNSSLSAAETNLANINERLENQKEEVLSLQKKLTSEFENLANKVLDEKSKTFKEENRQQLDAILNPFSQNLKEFKLTIKDTYEKGLKERTEISTELKQMQHLNQKLQEEAANLAKALKGDSQKQGRWGEMILERILESSGLENGMHYKLQDSFTIENGKRFRPDAVVYLPDDKHIIIDSKVSLVAYDKFVNAENEIDRSVAIKEHILSVRTHVKELASKDYLNNLGLNTPEYLLMFIPIEASFSAAMTYDNTVFNEAWDNRIVIVSPATLIATLMTVSAIWKQTKQTENALKIAERGGKLYDKFKGFVEDLEKVGAGLSKAQSEYEKAMNKLHTGSGNLVRQTEELKTLGAKTTKSIAKNILDSATELDDEQLPESTD
jgi:DNA recombination protein RmuC